MTTISRNQAICMFYGEKYTEENAARLFKKIEGTELEICHLHDPSEPILIWEKKVNQYPFRYNKYPECETSNETSTVVEISFTCQSQIVHFLNLVYLASDPGNENMYERQQVSMRQIFASIWQYTAFFDTKTLQAFTVWCTHKKLNFLKAPAKRKLTNTGDRMNVRTLFVLKNNLINNTAKGIAEHLPKHQALLHSLKKDGHTIVGYVRKSLTNDKEAKRIKLLQQMCDNLKQRSMVDVVFGSTHSKANDPFCSRDLTKRKQTVEDDDDLGNTQGKTSIQLCSMSNMSTLDMLEFIASKSKICIVALDHAGLTTNTHDLREFLRSHPQVKKIIVDKLPHTHEILVYDCKELVKDDELLQAFNCRIASFQRSKVYP
ncbi:uncharacterized protein BYT42DRAFT_528538 [Radiomyces spectabilis]|uniref:uncharacterized protein n=1 Tax=Radiomyces spectabilis TaxID=64574 RepID=UPI00222017B7|nr:uncharacterized protein BYT42DRAFT_528538 [Radiomyces spectabilis]KAI8388577.1 hypothetical protein BYT42DRAFT_528538 [Radiomyces spectabilis]